jgi:hypothetical protein
MEREMDRWRQLQTRVAERFEWIVTPQEPTGRAYKFRTDRLPVGCGWPWVV